MQHNMWAYKQQKKTAKNVQHIPSITTLFFSCAKLQKKIKSTCSEYLKIGSKCLQSYRLPLLGIGSRTLYTSGYSALCSISLSSSKTLSDTWGITYDHYITIKIYTLPYTDMFNVNGISLRLLQYIFKMHFYFDKTRKDELPYTAMKASKI